MSVVVRVNRVEEIELTPENEAELLSQEWDRRYDNRPFVPGDGVKIIRTARQRHADARRRRTRRLRRMVADEPAYCHG